MEDHRKHEFTIEIGATPEEVWRLLTEAEGITRWFAPEAGVTPGEGGSITLSWGPGMEGTAPVHRWEAGSKVGWTEGPKRIDFEIESIAGGRTRLRLIHSGFGADAKFDDEYDSTHGGWTSYLAMLQYAATEFRGRPMRQVHQTRMVPAAVGPVWQRLLHETGLAANSLADGSACRVRLAGRTLDGTVIRHAKPGYLCIAAKPDVMIALFVERGGPENAILTIQWFAAGERAMAETGAVKQALGELTDRLTASGA